MGDESEGREAGFFELRIFPLGMNPWLTGAEPYLQIQPAEDVNRLLACQSQERLLALSLGAAPSHRYLGSACLPRLPCSPHSHPLMAVVLIKPRQSSWACRPKWDSALK